MVVALADSESDNRAAANAVETFFVMFTQVLKIYARVRNAGTRVFVLLLRGESNFYSGSKFFYRIKGLASDRKACPIKV
jgi:hypothetical protein